MKENTEVENLRSTWVKLLY